MRLLGHRILVHFDEPTKEAVEIPVMFAPPVTDGVILLVGSLVKGQALIPGRRVRINRGMGSVGYEFDGKPCRIVSTLDVQLVFDAD